MNRIFKGAQCQVFLSLQCHNFRTIIYHFPMMPFTETVNTWPLILSTPWFLTEEYVAHNFSNHCMKNIFVLASS